MKIIVNNIEYETISLLGHGKGGYSYLSKGPNGYVVVKQIHHEPCDYYKFGNKIEAEYHDYQRLVKAGIPVPALIDIDFENEVIVKEYIDGNTIDELINDGESIEEYVPQVISMADTAKRHGLNIDYYPTNFVPYKGKLYYVDYECNEYMEEWDFPNWGKKYWKNKR